MSEQQAWSRQAYLDELRPDQKEAVRLGLFATYSVDLSALAATLLALIGRNNDTGSGTAVDFADAIDKLKEKVRVIIQRGRIARPIKLPQIAGILDQFIVEQPLDERSQSWHPKIALVAYCVNEKTRWKLWIGSRNLTRSQDLDAGVLIEGSAKRGKGRVQLLGIGALGATLARTAGISDPESLAAELDAMWWDAPAGFTLRALIDGLDQNASLSAAPPSGQISSITLISPFLSSGFLNRAEDWGPDGSRTLVSTIPALLEMAKSPSKPLRHFSKVLAYAAPDEAINVHAPDIVSNDSTTEDEAEATPLALHAKVYCFHMGSKIVVRLGSANATERAWDGRNSEIMIELAAGKEFDLGLDFLIGKAKPVSLEDLKAIPTPEKSEIDRLEESRKLLMGCWSPIMVREGENFTIVAQLVPELAYSEHRLEVSHANGELLPWPDNAVQLSLGKVPLSLQSAFIQVRIKGLERDLRWMQCVDVRPPLESGRDLAALSSHMGLSAFHDWMRTMLSGDSPSSDGTTWDADLAATKGSYNSIYYNRLTLEDILTSWARDKSAFARADRQFMPYVNALLMHSQHLSELEKADLRELSMIWAMARAQLTS